MFFSKSKNVSKKIMIIKFIQIKNFKQHTRLELIKLKIVLTININAWTNNQIVTLSK